MVPLHKGLAKLGKIVAETLLHAQMFPSLATQGNMSGKQCFLVWRGPKTQEGAYASSPT